MKKLFIACLVALSACSLSSGDDFRLVADFDQNEVIYVVYVPNQSIVELITTLSKYEKVGVFVQSEGEITNVNNILAGYQANTANIHYVAFPGADLWIRDSGPAILKNKNGELKAVDFRSVVQEFEQHDKAIAENLRLPVEDGKIISVGGARESNGDGTIIVAESFFRSKVPGFEKKKIEKEFKKYCGIENIIWLKNGLIEDELFLMGPVYDQIYPVGCGGHIDEFCRFVNANTVLLAEVDKTDLEKHPLYKINNDRLEENYKILKEFKGHELNIIRIPAAEFKFQQTSDESTRKNYDVVLTSSYLNFVIGNNIVLAAKYYEEGMPLSVKEKDERVKIVLQEQFPNHQILQINPQHLNARGGGYHCMTYNMPTGKRKGRRGKLS